MSNAALSRLAYESAKKEDLFFLLLTNENIW